MDFFSILINIKAAVMVALILQHEHGADIDPSPVNFD
jgi:hypothetical protein